jgi:hypothetical protein
MRSLIITFCLLGSALALQAGLITTQPAGTTTVLTTVTGTWAEGTSVVAGGFTVTGQNVWYGDANFSLRDNGTWSSFAWVGGIVGPHALHRSTWEVCIRRWAGS